MVKTHIFIHHIKTHSKTNPYSKDQRITNNYFNFLCLVVNVKLKSKNDCLIIL